MQVARIQLHTHTLIEARLFAHTERTRMGCIAFIYTLRYSDTRKRTREAYHQAGALKHACSAGLVVEGWVSPNAHMYVDKAPARFFPVVNFA